MAKNAINKSYTVMIAAATALKQENGGRLVPPLRVAVVSARTGRI
jgi:hypothetical protein